MIYPGTIFLNTQKLSAVISKSKQSSPRRQITNSINHFPLDGALKKSYDKRAVNLKGEKV